MENILSALEVNATLLALALAITFIVLGVTEKATDQGKLQEARIENAFFAIASLVAFLVFWLV